jgi:hypothetical protein
VTNDELAATFVANFAELHDKIATLPDSPRKTRADRLAQIAHRAMEALADIAVDGGDVQPFAGNDKPPPGP